MKSFSTVNLFDMQVSYFRGRYPSTVQTVALESIKWADGDQNTLIDEVTKLTAYHVDEFSAIYILSSSKNANSFLKEGPLVVENWQEMFVTLAQFAMEADVHAFIEECNACQEEEEASETGRLQRIS